MWGNRARPAVSCWYYSGLGFRRVCRPWPHKATCYRWCELRACWEEGLCWTLPCHVWAVDHVQAEKPVDCIRPQVLPFLIWKNRWLSQAACFLELGTAGGREIRCESDCAMLEGEVRSLSLVGGVLSEGVSTGRQELGSCLGCLGKETSLR